MTLATAPRKPKPKPVERIERNRWHQYRLGSSPWYPGATTVLRVQDALYGSDALVNWAGRIAAEEAIRATDEGAEREVALTRAMAELVKARDRGSAVHYGIEVAIRDEDHIPTPETHPYWYGWSRFLLAEKPELIRTEQKVINVTHGFGTTMDLIAHFRGQVAQLDIKSGSVKPSHKWQLAAGDMGEFWATEDGTEPPMPIETHYILHLDPTLPRGYEVIPMTVGDEERAHFAFLAKTYHVLKAAAKAAKEGEA